MRAERGAQGGCRLARSPARIKVADVIAAVDGSLALTDCATATPSCERLSTCRLRPNWLRIDAAIHQALSDISLQDVLDPAFAPGVSHPEPGGLSTRDVIGVLQRLSGPVVGADLVELNPTRDPTGTTAMAAAKLAKELAARLLSPSP